MASISKLSIRGVRSFSPDDAEQVLEFYFPCTIIVGANGCGKTTIIESLKFAVCGAMPPGNKSGQAFVHDPRSIGQSVVKANIKLRFNNRAGNSMVVVRSMEVQQKKTTMSFKQLDGVLRTVDKDGNRQSLSHKCTELDRQIPLLLGVSKPILEHVVFCHQEDSSWPLQEGAVLKKRFDDIFDSTRYSKALDVFAKLKKEYTLKVKDLKADLAGLASHKHAVKGFKDEISKHKNQIEEVEDRLEENRRTLQENEKEQERIRQIIEHVDSIKNDIESSKNDLTLKQQVSKKQKSMLHEDLTVKHSSRELKEMLRDFDSQSGNQLEKKQEMDDEVEALRRDLSKLRRQETDLQSAIGRLQAERESHQRRLKLRYEKMVEIGQAYGLGDALTPASQSQATQSQNNSFNASSLLDSSASATALGSETRQETQPPILDISKEDMDVFNRAIDRKEDELKEALTHYRKTRQEQEDTLQGQLADTLGKLKSIESERAKLNKQQSEARKELQSIGNKMSASRVRKNDLEESQRAAEKAAKERDELNKDPMRTQIPIQIRSLEEKIDKLKRDIEDDQIVLSDLRRSSEDQNAIVVLKEQCAKEMETLDDKIREQSFVFQKYNIAPPGDLPGSQGGDETGAELTDSMEEVVGSVSEKFDELNSRLSKATNEVSQSQREVSEKTALLSHDQRSAAGKRERLDQLRSSTDQVRRAADQLRQYENRESISTPQEVNEDNPQELMSYISKRLEEEEAQSTEGVQPQIVKKIMSKLKSQVRRGSKFTCPCCDRDFIDEAEIEVFQDQMKLLASRDSPLLKLDKRNKAARANYEKWRTAVSGNLNGALESTRLDKEVKELELNIGKLSRSLQESTSKLEGAKAEASDIQSQVEELRETVEASKRWLEEAGRIADKRIQINQKQHDLSMSSANQDEKRDLQQVEKDLADQMEEKDRHSNTINKLNKEVSALNGRINSASIKAARMEKLARDKEAKFAQEKELADRKQVLAKQINDCTIEEKKLQDEIAPLRSRLRSKESEKNKLRSLGAEEEERLNNAVNAFVGSVAELKSVVTEIEEYAARNKSDDLDEQKRKSDALKDKAADKQRQIEELQPAIDDLAKSIEDQERHRKNLKENIDLINARKKIDELAKTIEKLEEEVSNVEGHDTCYDDMDSLARRKQSVDQAVAELMGRRREINENVRSLKKRLMSPEYKDVEEEHNVAEIRYDSTQMAVRDLNKYHAALDKALLRFHSLKITEINTIIRELWNLTYKGEDITTIEIVSGQDSGSRATRSYNYRVVMTKGNTQLDMRGRCSAGQRVLASIVIRLALAETFCINCGCIALDEPTVNLDYNNKKGLAAALAQIIASRAQQSNFQLVLITHDEDFVTMMKTELSSQTGFNMPEKYFQVRREEGNDGKFYSKIDAIDWDELV